jgi:large subunit ribosomal protein L25
MHVPLHFLNEEQCVGVKIGGGSISHQMSEVVVECLAKDLPEFIEVDMAAMEIGQVVHLSDLKLPEGVDIPGLRLGPEHDLPVVSVNKARGAEEEEEAAAPPEAAAPQG